jgi:uracil-DNA glycosylase family 4
MMASREQQSAYLQAMGIQVWSLRDAPATAPEPLPVVSETATVSESVVGEAPVSESPAKQAAVPQSQSDVASANVPPLMDEEPPMPTDDNMPSLDMSEMEAPPAAPPRIDVSTLDWPELQAAVANCTACELHKTRTQTVFGVGNHAADWMIIGEAPGAEEDKQGEPFVGAAGQLLNNMLRALGLQREEVFIANILKCRPPGNRNPHVEEAASCEAFLKRQVELVQPKVILSVGGVSAHNLLKVDTAVSKLRGQVHHYQGIPVVVTYHPAYLLRKPSEKAKSWADLRFAAAVVRGERS